MTPGDIDRAYVAEQPGLCGRDGDRVVVRRSGAETGGAALTPAPPAAFMRPNAIGVP